MSTLVDKYIQDMAGLTILTVMATRVEYGDALRGAGVRPFIIGVGPRQAAMNTTRILAGLEAETAMPDLIMNIGSAGSDKFAQGAILQVASITYRDMDAAPFGFATGVTPFSDYETPIIHVAAEIPGFAKASISSGGNVVNQQGSAGVSFADIDADMVDMETAAVQTVANEFDIPMIGLGGFSDGKEPTKGYETWTAALGMIDRALADVYQKMARGLAAGEITKQQLTAMPPEWHQVQAKRTKQ